MVLKTLRHIVIGSETLVSLIIIVIYPTPGPAMTFYAKMVVALTRKLTTPGCAFKQSLRKRYTGRYFMSDHLFNSKILIQIYISLID